MTKGMLKMNAMQEMQENKVRAEPKNQICSDTLRYGPRYGAVVVQIRLQIRSKPRKYKHYGIPRYAPDTMTGCAQIRSDTLPDTVTIWATSLLINVDRRG